MNNHICVPPHITVHISSCVTVTPEIPWGFAVALKQLSSIETVEVTANADGWVWLFIVTDSGFESLTEIYYTWVEAIFEPI